jgi:hypothetical protein
MTSEKDSRNDLNPSRRARRKAAEERKKAADDSPRIAMLNRASVNSNNLSRIENPRGPSCGWYSGNAGLRSFCETFTIQTLNLTSEIGAKAGSLT